MTIQLDRKALKECRDEMDTVVDLIGNLQAAIGRATEPGEVFSLIDLLRKQADRLNALNARHASILMNSSHQLISDREYWAMNVGDPRRMTMLPAYPNRVWVQVADDIYWGRGDDSVFRRGEYYAICYNQEMQTIMASGMGRSANIPLRNPRLFYEVLTFHPGDIVRPAIADLDFGIFDNPPESIADAGTIGKVERVNYATDLHEFGPTVVVKWDVDDEDARQGWGHRPNELRLKGF